jgi:hypothetical protein
MDTTSDIRARLPVTSPPIVSAISMLHVNPSAIHNSSSLVPDMFCGAHVRLALTGKPLQKSISPIRRPMTRRSAVAMCSGLPAKSGIAFANTSLRTNALGLGFSELFADRVRAVADFVDSALKFFARDIQCLRPILHFVRFVHCNAAALLRPTVLEIIRHSIPLGCTETLTISEQLPAIRARYIPALPRSMPPWVPPESRAL